MRISHFLPVLFLLSSKSISSLELIPSSESHHSLQKRQLDWNGPKSHFNYDHVAVSSSNIQKGRRRSIDSDVQHHPNSNNYQHHHSSTGGLPGQPGIDYPVLPSIPLTGFHCRGRVPGYYGDTETACQVFHVCGMDAGRQDSFLCPNGTIFSQKVFACDWWYNVQCQSTQQHYRLNRNLFQGSNINLYGTPSFWNWLSDVEETYPADKQRPAVTAQKEETYRPRNNPNEARARYNPEFIEEDLKVYEDPEDPVPVTLSAPKEFGWIDDTPTPQLDSNTAPELAWTDLSPNGPDLGGQLRPGHGRRRKVRRRQNKNRIVQQEQEKRAQWEPVAAPVKPVTTARPSLQLDDRHPQEEQQYYYFDKASGSFKPVEKVRQSVEKVRPNVEKIRPNIEKVRPNIEKVRPSVKPTIKVTKKPIVTTTTTTAPPEIIRTNPPKAVVRSAKKLPQSQTPSQKVFKSAGHVKLAHSGLAMERVDPPFRPSKQIKANKVILPEFLPTPQAEEGSRKRKRSRQSNHPGTGSPAYDPRLDRTYNPAHPIYQMVNWESTKL